MNKRKIFSLRILNMALLIMLCCGVAHKAKAETEFCAMPHNALDAGQLVLNSYGFNAQKKSNFKIAGQTEQLQRGLTIIHFHTADKFEYRTFDTHGSEEASEKVVQILKLMQNNNAAYAILAHDSATKSLGKQTEKLARMGFSRLGNLKNRQAYLMHNLEGKIYENVDDLAAKLTIGIPKITSDDKIYFPKLKPQFKPNNNRYIAHAGGEVNGIKSTNTKDALDQNYKKGFRFFELDIIETSDGIMVAAHDWNMWSRFTDYKGTLPPTHAEFMKEKIYGDYTTLDMDGINEWFTAHSDATLVTDKINDPVAFASKFVDKSRLIMELFSVMAVDRASKNGITAMISQKPLMKLKGDKLNFLAVNNVKHVALSRRMIEKRSKLMSQLKKGGIKVYVYHVNFDAGKDERFVLENEIGLVYGMYADKWVFDQPDGSPSK